MGLKLRKVGNSVALISEHDGSSGIRDMGAVLSSLARPRSLFAYDEGVGLAQIAAACIYGILKNHGFAGGNKRTSLVVGDVFLMLNGYELTPSSLQTLEFRCRKTSTSGSECAAGH